MNLFFARLTGKLMTAEKAEKYNVQLLADAQRYREIEASEEYKEFLALEKETSDQKFLAKKQDTQSRKYKDTEYYQAEQELKSLSREKSVKTYLAAKTAEEKDAVAGTIEVKKYLELQQKTATAEWKKAAAFWQDKNRWATTEEGKKEARLAQLRKNANILFAQKADIRQIEEIESWKQTWVAEFNAPTLEKNGMKPGFWFKQAAMKTDFSYVGEDLAYTGEKNVNIQNGILSIITKKEHVSAPAWDAKKGFTMHEFPYTSAVVNTGDSFSQPIGMFVAKVKATGKCHSAIHLVGEDRFPVIELFHYNGKKLVVGFTDKNGSEREVISGLNANEWMILTVLVNRQEIIWNLNNREVFRAKNPLPGQALHFSCQSFAPQGKGGESRMDIGYLKAYTR